MKIVEDRMYQKNDLKDVPVALNLFFTGKCNLNCTYCFVDKRGQEKKTLDEKSIKKSIDELFCYPGKRKVISFNGGEPLLEWDLLKRIHLYAYKKARREQLALDIVVVSNGTLLRQEMVDFFIKYKTILKVSVDGKKETHDKQRPLLRGSSKSTFDLVMKNIQEINWKGMPVAASVVFTPQSLDSFAENIDFLAKKNFSFVEIYPDIHAVWGKGDIIKLKKALKKFEQYYIESFKNGEAVFKNSLLDGIVNDVRLEKNESCVNVQADCAGNYYVCDKVLSLPAEKRGEYEIGNIRDGLADAQRLRLLSGLRAEIKKSAGLKCQACQYERYCFCPIGSYIFHKFEKKRNLGFWKNFCQVSGIIIGTYVNIAKELEYNERFVELYRF